MAFKKLRRFWLIPVIILLIAVNWAASVYHTRLDLTAEKRFTLSKSTHNLLKSIDGDIEIEVFLKGNYPSGFRKLSDAVQTTLNEFQEIAGSRLRYRMISPDEEMPGTGITYGDTLSGIGLYPINLTSQLKEGQQQQLVYPYAMVHAGGQSIPVTLYQGKTPLINFQELNRAEAMLEYRFAHAISRIIRTEKPLIGYATGNGEPMDYTVFDLVENVLRTDYEVATLDLTVQPLIPEEFSVLVIVKPTKSFTENEKLKIDQYLMKGGKLLVFIDRLEAEMDSLQIKNEVVAYDRDLKLNDLFFRYGARVNGDLVMDLQCDYLPFDVSGNGQFELLPWNYFPILEPPSNHPINKNLGFISSRFVNSIDTVGAEGIRKHILLRSSANSRTLGTPALISGKENIILPEHEKYRQKNIPVAVLLEGKFRSLYANRLTNAMNDSLQKYGQMFQPQALNETQIIIAGDGDIVQNTVIQGGQPIPMGMNHYTYGTQREFPFANRAFVENCLEYLVNEFNLSEAKGKDYVLRLLDNKRVDDERAKWQLINIAAPVILIVLLAMIFQFIRRKRYSY